MQIRQIKALLKAALPVFALAAVLQGCNTTDSGSGSSKGTLSSGDFPILQMNNWWQYTDGNGHHLSLTVVDTVIDNQVTYYKVVFAQQGVDTLDDWFIQNSTGTEYGANLLGPYALFLPQHLSTGGGTFKSDTVQVSYMYSDSANEGGAEFRKVLELDYSSPLYHGFNKVALADSLGIVSLAATAGQIFPVIYNLDSAFVGGKVTRY